MSRQRIHVFEITAVRVVGEKIAPENEAANLKLADPALGQRSRRNRVIGFKAFGRWGSGEESAGDTGGAEERLLYNCSSVEALPYALRWVRLKLILRTG